MFGAQPRGKYLPAALTPEKRSHFLKREKIIISVAYLPYLISGTNIDTLQLGTAG
ncbi:hypothetical protein NBG4_260007 [Candidatus Sulfobium mesophilum]|uniref:Uncharacterized protein n=1 Tax=Candidatus Sulfobium mesophilum TaxID=2016548 RepID=A0A2U3QGI1_9BACT|nr:hypothetical protein NBG4_260007 [Candidatus Sulfobium mesophilum]